MPFSVTWDSQEAIPEALRSLATEKDGKFVFEGETSSEVEGLRGTARTERDRRVKLEREAKTFERFKPLADADEDEFSQFLEGWSKRGEGGKPEPDAGRSKLHEKELLRRDKEIGELKTENDNLKLDLREFQLWTPIRSIAVAAGLDEKNWELARLELANQKRFDFDSEGKIVVMEDGIPSTVTPERFFKEVYSDQRPNLYRPTGAGGSGAGNGNQGGKGRQDYSKLSATERLKAVRRQGA